MSPEQESQEQIITTSSNEPYKTAAAAAMALAKKDLAANEWSVEPYGAGFAIARNARPQKPEILEGEKLVDRSSAAGTFHKGEKYFRVRFHERVTKNEPRDVELRVKGELLQIQRGKIVIIAERYRECADHTRRPHYISLPNDPLKREGFVHTYPYDVLGEATEEEFLALYKQGVEESRKNLKTVI